MEVLYRRCCGLDVHKETVAACLRVVSGGEVVREVLTFETTTAMGRHRFDHLIGEESEFIGTYRVSVSLSKNLVVRFVSAVQNSAEECPGQQSPQPPAARKEAPPSPESPPEPVPARAAIAGPAP
jgi:hypothetical protein